MKYNAIMCCILIYFGLSDKSPKKVPVSKLGTEFELVGKLGEPLGSSLMLTGVLVESYASKGGPGPAHLQVQKLQGRYTQKYLDLDLGKEFLSNWKTDGGPPLEYGKTYEMIGYETGSFIGIPSGLGEPIQSVGFHFALHFQATVVKNVDPVNYTPRMVFDYPPILQGTAKTTGGHSTMEGTGWSVVVKRNMAWPDSIEGKPIETQGVCTPVFAGLGRGNETFNFVGVWRLRNLSDQVGKMVYLRGQHVVTGKSCALYYRGDLVVVERGEDCCEKNSYGIGSPIVVEGLLEKYALQIEKGAKEIARGLEQEWGYKVVGAHCKPLSTLLLPDEPVTFPGMEWE